MTQNQISVKTQSHQVIGTFDPAKVLSLFEHEDVLLFESADVVTKLGEKSMLFMDCALKIEARSHMVTIKALLSEARPVLLALRSKFCDAVRDFQETSLTLEFLPLYHHLDLIKKMRAPSALDVLRFIMTVLSCELSHKKNLMLAGTFSYDFLDHFEKLPEAHVDIHHYPDYLFYLPLTVVVIDHKTKQTEYIAHELEKAQAQPRLQRAKGLVQESFSMPTVDHQLDAMFMPKGFSVDIPDQEFGRLVERCKDHIAAGDVYQIVPSRTFSYPINDPLRCYQALRLLNPSPYMFYVHTHDWTLLGASPETFIKVDQGGKRVSVRPIAGTRRRGFHDDGTIDEELDSREQASLCLDEKELAEHMMLVDLARNDIASVCKPKSRRIRRMLCVDRFSHVMHLVSEVEGMLLPDFDALSAYQASMNMGTLMGAPKVRAAELLRELEATKRGFYGGAVGYIDGLGNMDTAIIIRSALVHNKTAHVRAGCGVVHDSNIQFETEETLNKAEATLRALSIASTL